MIRGLRGENLASFEKGDVMKAWLEELDHLLRGRKTAPALLAEGTQHLRIGHSLSAAIILALIYGAFMGLFAVLNRTPPCTMQLISSTVKTPALYLLTLAVTFPSLYVFSALLNARLSLAGTLRIVLASIAVTTAVLASLGPITGFFSLTTKSYDFIKLLNVVFFAAAGIIGLRFLLIILRRLESAGKANTSSPAPADPAFSPAQNPPTEPPRAPSVAPRVQRSEEDETAGKVFRAWLVLYALVGMQMAWVLRPFIGTPGMGFTWLRARESNIFVDLLRTIGRLFNT